MILPGVGIIVVFLIFAALMYLRVLPALLAVPLMAVCMAAVAQVPAGGIATIVAAGAHALAAVIVTVVFGAILGRVTLDTGIAKAIVNFAAEFGGERPAIVALILCAVVALLFVSLSGLGAIIMVGSIVLPIMMTTGVPRKVAATLFLMAFALGFIFNIVNWKFYTQLFGVAQSQMYAYAIVLAAIDVVALLLYALFAFRRTRDYAAWAVKSEEDDDAKGRGVPWWSLVTPVLPIVLYFVLKLDPIVLFAISAIYGVLTTRPREAVRTLAAAAVRGTEDVAPAIVLFIGIGMLLEATKAPQFQAALHPLLAHGLLHNPIAYVVIFGICSPLVLYRGPLNPFGVGIAVFTVMLSAGVFPAVILVAAVMAVVQVQNVCDPTNTQNVWVANYTGVNIAEITKRALPFQAAVATAACVVVVAAAPQLFGVSSFASPFARAQASELFSGLFVPPRAARHVAVGDDGTADGKIAADEVAAALNRWDAVRAFRAVESPNASDCTAKNYAAYVEAVTTPFHLTEGTDLDVGLKLYDCGGWEVNQWHDHAVYAKGPSRYDVQVLAVEGEHRLQAWARREPIRSANLLQRGLAYKPGQKPTYYYALFKTVDGNMRVYVRAGGPAYDDGLRTNDIVSKLDGRYWWEYGTYQTELRAYDGRPHTFDVQRGKETLHITLGEPFS